MAITKNSRVRGGMSVDYLGRNNKANPRRIICDNNDRTQDNYTQVHKTDIKH